VNTSSFTVITILYSKIKKRALIVLQSEMIFLKQMHITKHN